MIHARHHGPRGDGIPVKRGIDDRQRIRAGNKGHAVEAEDAQQPRCLYFHWSWRRRHAGCRLRKCRRERGVEPDVPLDLLHRLVNVAVEHSHRTEPLQQRERLRTVVRAPSPFRVHAPQRDVCEDDNGCTARERLHIPLHPIELLGPEGAKPTGFEIHHVDEGDEVHSGVIETVPALGRLVPVATQILGAVVGEHVMLARDIEDAIGLDAFDHLIGGVELVGLGQLADVAGMQDERRAFR